MKQQSWLVGAAVVGMSIATLTACSDDSESSESSESSDGTTAGVVSVKDVPELGQALVDSSGKTLYFADQEADGSIRCTGACLSFWFPVLATGDTESAGIDGLAQLVRSDNGQQQLTYQGKPLYTFKLDTGPAQHNGHNLEDSFGGTTFTWRAASTSGTGSTDAPPSQSDGDYGY
ncbi:MAG: COG4315 family predicted lipoprotein [Nocardioidaceae bacterium]